MITLELYPGIGVADLKLGMNLSSMDHDKLADFFKSIGFKFKRMDGKYICEEYGFGYSTGKRNRFFLHFYEKLL